MVRGGPLFGRFGSPDESLEAHVVIGDFKHEHKRRHRRSILSYPMTPADYAAASANAGFSRSLTYIWLVKNRVPYRSCAPSSYR